MGRGLTDSGNQAKVLHGYSVKVKRDRKDEQFVGLHPAEFDLDLLDLFFSTMRRVPVSRISEDEVVSTRAVSFKPPAISIASFKPGGFSKT